MIKEKSVFKGLGQRDLGILARTADILNLEKNDAAIHENDPGERIIMVIDGSLQIEKKGCYKSPRPLGVLKKGDIYGEASFLIRQPSPVSVIAREPSTLFVINQQILDSLGRDLELFFYRRISAIARERINIAERKVRELDVRNKITANQMFCRATAHIPGIESSEFIREVIRKIPRLPVFALSLTGKLMVDDISSKEIAGEVRKDPSLAGMILKTINSSYQGMACKISDLHDAIVFLGFNTVSQITIAEGLRRSLPDSPLFRQIHDHSQAISYISFEIARHFGVSRPSEISTISILHDLGQIVIQLLKMKNPTVDTLFDQMDSALIGSMLLRSWELPDMICQSVQYQSYPEFALPGKIPETVRSQVTILFLSHLCYDYFRGKARQELPLCFMDQYLKGIHVKSDGLDAFARHHILPGLIQKMKCLPDSFVTLLGDYLKKPGLKAS